MLITVTNIGTVTVQDSYLYDYMEGSFIYANNAQVWDPTGSHYYYEPDYLYVDPVTGETWMTWEFGYNLAPGESYSVMFDVVAVGDPCEVDYNYAEADYYCPPTSQYEYTNEDDASVEVQGTVWNVDKEIWYCTIQDAVDDADSCNTIVAYPAVYEEQVYINIDLTLIGMDGAIIVPPDSPRTTYTFPESSNTFDPIIFANGEGGIISVDVIGFDIDGLNKADNTPRFVGILYRNVQPGTHMALIAENTIFNMYDPDGEGDGPQTSGILVYGDSYVYIEDNHVVDFSRLGIGALGDDSWRDDPFVEISGNLVIGNGFEPMTGWWADNGIQIGYGAGGIVSENTLDDFYSNSAWYSTAILIYDAASGVEILDNDVTNSQLGIAITSPSYDIIDGNTVMYCNEGLRLGWPTDNALVTNNLFRYCDYGITIFDAVDNMIDGNIIRDNNEVAIWVDGDSHRNTIVNNFILDNPTGILVTEYYVEPTDTVVHYNYIDTNCSLDIGIENQVTDVVDADLNYWGAGNGPGGMIPDADTGLMADGSGELVIGNVNFDPWWGVGSKGEIVPLTAEVGEVIFFDAGDAFANDKTGNIDGNIAFLWDLDHNNHYSMDEAFAYVYDAPGTYNVELETRIISYSFDSLSDYMITGFMYDRATFALTVTSPSSTLQANADPNDFGSYEGIIGEDIQFYGDAIGGTPPYTYHWDFTDGTTSEIQNPIHSFADDGTYYVILTVTDSAGDSASDTAPTGITEPGALQADAGGPYSGYTEIPVEFFGSATGGVGTYTYMWDFGDGTGATGQNPTHTYTAEGTYNALLIVTDSEGNVDDHNAHVTIELTDDVVEITDVNGGLGIRATIKAGTEPVDWSINVDGKFIFHGGSASGTIEANGVQTVKLPFSLGLGRVEITITAADIVEKRSAFMLGPFILAVQEL
jgi:PKD repeat protein